MKRTIMHIDQFTRICGFFNSSTSVNNHYGCDHVDCEEKEIVKIDKNGDEVRHPDRIKHKIEIAALRKKFGSWQDIVKAAETEEGKKYIMDVRFNKIHDPNFVAQFGCRLQGKCYAFSCPLAGEADLQDLKELDNDLYEEWKDEEYEPQEAGADLLVVPTELIKS